MPKEITHIPQSPLNQFVNAIWIGKEDHVEFQDKNRALLLTELIFNYGDNYILEGQHIWNTKNSHSQHIISGLKTSPFKLNVSGAYCNIGLILKPYCYGLLINAFGSDSMNTVSDLLFEYLILSPVPDFHSVEKHLIHLFSGKPIDKNLIKFENHISHEFLRKGALRDFNTRVSISQKSFIQKFKKNYLLTPSQFVKLKQVSYAAQMLETPIEQNLTQVGLEAGFYDQSHFIRVFKRFCGITPREFLKRKKSPG